jgi:hypothetical protein
LAEADGVEVEVAGVCYDHPCYSEVAQ